MISQVFNSILAGICLSTLLFYYPTLRKKGAFRTLASAFLLLGIYFIILAFKGAGPIAHLCVLSSIPLFWVYLNRLVSPSTSAVATCIWFTPAFLLLGFDLCGITFQVDTTEVMEKLYRYASIAESFAIVVYCIFMGRSTGLSVQSIFDYLLHDGKLHIAHIQYIKVSVCAAAMATLNIILIINNSLTNSVVRVAFLVVYVIFFLLLAGIGRIGLLSETEALSRKDQGYFYMKEREKTAVFTASNQAMAAKYRQREKLAPAPVKKEFWQKKEAEPGSLQESFEELLIRQEYFLKPGITLIEMAQIMKTNKTYLSKMVNTTYEMSFSDLLNGLRIEYAKKYLVNNPNAKQEESALACGFPTASAFNYSFKKETGVTPKIWLATQPDNA